jgi:DNA modification methylase
MAGGGTTIDVCKAMARRYLAYDLHPSRPDIQQHDTQLPFPLPPSIANTGTRASLVFLDPPYWKQRRGEYMSGGLDGLELDQFYAAIERIIENACRVLGPNGYIALIIGPTQEDKIVFDHAAVLLRFIDLPLIRRIIVPYNTQQHGGAYVNSATENRYPLYLYRDLMVWQCSGE